MSTDESRKTGEATEATEAGVGEVAARRVGDCGRHDAEDMGLGSSARCTCPPVTACEPDEWGGFDTEPKKPWPPATPDADDANPS